MAEISTFSFYIWVCNVSLFGLEIPKMMRVLIDMTLDVPVTVLAIESWLIFYAV